MDCRETQALLTAFHDGELPGVDRARVTDHLRGCPECGARLADLARVDAAASVPDPGPAYWERFNARVMDRVEREAEGPKAAVLRPKHGWVRQQLRYLVPAVAAAAMVVVVVRYGGLHTGAPTPVVPPAVHEPAAPDRSGERAAKVERESSATKTREPAAVARRVPEESNRVAGDPAAPPPVISDERSVTAARGERDRLADRSLFEAKERTPQDRVAAPAGIDAPSTVQGEQKKMAEAAAPAAEPQLAGKAESPCQRARTLADQKRWREAETAQRACLAQDRSAPAQEKGLVFLAELLDRQERFADADKVITQVEQQFPRSRPLDLYRQQRPMVQKQPMAVPVTR